MLSLCYNKNIKNTGGLYEKDNNSSIMYMLFMWMFSKKYVARE